MSKSKINENDKPIKSFYLTTTPDQAESYRHKTTKAILADIWEYSTSDWQFLKIDNDGHHTCVKEELAREWYLAEKDNLSGYGDADEALDRIPNVFREHLIFWVVERYECMALMEQHKSFERSKLY